MPTTVTPIRYPGGKTKLYSFLKEILTANNLVGGTYCEPFAGGAGLALKLLLKNDVSRIVINDADPAIYSVWDMILKEPDELCAFIETVEVTTAEWKKQKAIYDAECVQPCSNLAKATFFLNRTNISGVITGGMIGGKEQEGKYKIDARFSRNNLITKIRNIASLAERIDLYNYDVLEFMDVVLPRLEDNTLVNFDPPYVSKGSKLYKNAFSKEDHSLLRDRIADCRYKWIVTYDICDYVKALYKDYRGDYVNVYYSANVIRKAQEYVFYSNDLIIPGNI